jgi:hypothetical protein
MMVPIRGGEVRSGMGSVLSGLMVCIKWIPERVRRCDGAPCLGRGQGFVSSNRPVSSRDHAPK